MKPNNLGGMSYEGAEIPVVIAAASHQNPEFAEWLSDEASRTLEQQRMTAAGVNVLSFFEWQAFQQSDKSKIKVTPELHLNNAETTRTYGHLSESFDAGLFPRQQRPIARSILVEAGLIEPTRRERVVTLLRRLFG